MWRKTGSIAVLVFLACFHFLFATKAGIVAVPPVDLEISTLSDKGQLLSHVLKVVNHAESAFSGIIGVNAPTGIRVLSQDERTVYIAAGDSGFASFKLLLTKDLTAGEKRIRYDLLNEAKEHVVSRETSLEIKRHEQLILLTDNAPVLITNPEDSVRLRVTIKNNGNISEQITLVFNVPNLRSAAPFTEMTASVLPGEQREFIHSFIASSNLLAAERFEVRITAMKGSEKKIVDSRTITIHNISTRRSYNSFLLDQMTEYSEGISDNAVQLSYRTYNYVSSTIQLQGGGYLDLPAGFLHLKGNIYQYNIQPLPYVTNTSLTYRLHEHEFSLGNVGEQAELSLYGRGAKASFSDSTRNKRLTIGAIDQNYNLLSGNPWFDDYYSFFIKGELGASTGRTGATVGYIFQRNPYEQARFQVGSLAWRFRFNDLWELEMMGYGSMAQYWDMEGSKLTGTAELRYQGTLFSDLILNGSAYYSDPYFSGNRKGVTSFNQNISKRITDGIHLNGSFSYNKSEPKSYAYNYNYRSQNSFGSFSVSLPPLPGFTSSLMYNYQGESSSSYSRYVGEGAADRNLTMDAHRLGWQWRWQHPAGNHSLYGSLEGGYYRNPVNKSRERQGKASLSYAYRWLTTGITWQQGAYYLYEQVMAQQQNRMFTRFSASALVNHRFSKKIQLTSGFNFTRDVYQGSVPSVNIQARYFTRHNFSLSFSGYWYQYPFMQNRDILNLEVGVRYQFRKGQPLTGKKSTLIAKVYYDYNGNGRYDKGDTPAEGYLLDIDRKAFVSGSNGEVRYTSVPFGNYSVKPMQTGEWSFGQQEIEVNRFKTVTEIPLRQSGTLQGSIRYEASENSVEIVQRNEGFRFTISGHGGRFQQTVVTDDYGRFIAFLPVGEYTITLDKRTLVEHTDCAEPVQNFRMEVGRVNELEPFVIGIKTRKVNVKKFFAQEVQ